MSHHRRCTKNVEPMADAYPHWRRSCGRRAKWVADFVVHPSHQGHPVRVKFYACQDHVTVLATSLHRKFPFEEAVLPHRRSPIRRMKASRRK